MPPACATPRDNLEQRLLETEHAVLDRNAAEITRMTVSNEFDLSEFNIAAISIDCANRSSVKFIEQICELSQDTDLQYRTSKSNLLLTLVNKFAVKSALGYHQHDSSISEECFEFLKVHVRMLVSRDVDITTNKFSYRAFLSILRSAHFLWYYFFWDNWWTANALKPTQGEMDRPSFSVSEIEETTDWLPSLLTHRVEALAFLINSGCDPNAKQSEETISYEAAGDDVTWNIWKAAIAQAGFLIHPRDTERESIMVVKADQALTAAELAAETERLVRIAGKSFRREMFRLVQSRANVGVLNEVERYSIWREQSEAERRKERRARIRRMKFMAHGSTTDEITTDAGSTDEG